jgi:hypothetical protein
LRHHAVRQIADFAQSFARKVAGHPQRQRRDHVPQPPNDRLGAPGIFQPVTGAGSDGDDAIDALAIGNEAEQLATEAVPDPVQRQIGRLRFDVIDDRGTVLPRPIENVHGVATQRSRRREADAAIVEGGDVVSLLRQPQRKFRVELLRDAHCRGNDHRRLGRSSRAESAEHQRIAVRHREAVTSVFRHELGSKIGEFRLQDFAFRGAADLPDGVRTWKKLLAEILAAGGAPPHCRGDGLERVRIDQP